jgi:hypothetical protein
MPSTSLSPPGNSSDALSGRQRAGVFEEARHADAAQLSAPIRLAAALLEFRVV